MRIPCENISRTISFFDESRAVIEVVRCSQRAGFLNSPLEGIVLERRRSAVGAGNSSLSQPVLEVPGVLSSRGVGEGIAVCVFYLVSDPHRDSDFRFSNSDCSFTLCSFSGFVDTAFSSPDSRDSAASASSTSLFNASARL